MLLAITRKFLHLRKCGFLSLLFKRLVQSAWNSFQAYGSAAARMVFKLKKLREVVTNWAKEHFLSVKETKSKLLEELLKFEILEETGALDEDDKNRNKV